MARKRRTRRTKKRKRFKTPIIVRPKMRQIGKSDLARDRKRKALPPGKRISKYGRVYYEYRKNRSDISKT